MDFDVAIVGGGFAGEATADEREGGTVAGALQSGIRAAREVHAARSAVATTVPR